MQILLTAESSGDRKECSSELWNQGQDTPTHIDSWRGLEFLKADLEEEREVTLLCFLAETSSLSRSLQLSLFALC